MRTRTTRTVDLLVLLSLLVAAAAAAAGCGSEKAGDNAVGTDPYARTRARQVAEAWDGSQAAETWRKGYYAMTDEVQLPEGAFHDNADKIAFTTRNFVLRTELPASPDKRGRVEWDGGASLDLPLMSAREAYETVARGSNDGPRLTVTGAKSGRMTLTTSRGPATVPAWLFTLKGYDTPLKRAAVGSEQVPKSPVEPSRAVPDSVLAALGRLVEVAGDGRSVTVLAHHGSCDDGPAVHALETDGSVVLYASVVGTREGPCTRDLRAEEVTVRLARPVGDRVLLDAFTGRPVPNGPGRD
ncbi:hypothetical protein [Streptomyces siamensis]|uniref:Lipoprotein n=1 Tax=Streptomyces siamensis TaxID=1274986 RepID=A0ABP9IQ77_9ACTN